MRGEKPMEAWWKADPRLQSEEGSRLMALVIDDGKVRSTRRLIDDGWAIEMEMECLKDGTTATMVFSFENGDAPKLHQSSMSKT